MVHAKYALALAALATVGGASLARVALGDDRAATAALVAELDRDAAHKPATNETLARAKDALERATRLRAAGDEGHAALADGLARVEAETARDLVRAIDAERAANDTRRAAIDAGVVGERERALLEEGIARNGRLRAEIEQSARPHAEARTAPDATAGGRASRSAQESAAADGGAPRAQTGDAGVKR